ncbi:hypothetical protein AVEN_24136-1 [Araneus ventricosus]|uniref:Uncharacterized protein n=1 Tax=Araneus ventricosus TaxID=182803 RepID=A0A4Y2L887_ARAVE|nr:hypothetical protein AVEN_24136-1 [Araneus ventricosus]
MRVGIFGSTPQMWLLATSYTTEHGTPVDIEQCVRGLKLELMKCVSDGAAVVVENIAQSPDETGVKEDEIKCS